MSMDPSSMYDPNQYGTQYPQRPYTPGPPVQQQPAGYEYNGVSQPVKQEHKFDLNDCPSAIDIMEKDKQIYMNKNGPFYSDAKGLLPPLVTTPFVTYDHGNSAPRFIRSSMYSVPIQPELMKQSSIPFNLVINPFARKGEGEFDPPIADMSKSGIVRCKMCRAYMCPFMKFINGGCYFNCPFCKTINKVTDAYFEHLDCTEFRIDKYDRAELCLGTYEFLATEEYCKNKPKPPAYIFVIDVTYNNVKSGLVELLCRNMKHILESLPMEQGVSVSAPKVGFITYSNQIHFYNIKASLAKPQMMVVGDVREMFLPLLDGLLSDVSQANDVIDKLMLQIPAMYANSEGTEAVLGPAIKAGLEILKAEHCAGKLLVFHSSFPAIADDPGKLTNRSNNKKLLGTDKEKSVLAPQSQFYNELGKECARAACSVDLFVSNNTYADLATIGQVARLSGGQVHNFTHFQSAVDGDRLMQDVKRSLESTMGFDALMMIRTSTSCSPADYFGHFFMEGAMYVTFAAVDTDKAVTVELKHNAKLTDDEAFYIQVATLYTSVGGQRRLRILNLSLNVCDQLPDMYRSCDLDTIMNLLTKQAVANSLNGTPKKIRESLVNRGAQILACYRKNCSHSTPPKQLILPENLKLLPIYINCLLNCGALGGSDIDDRAFNMYAVATMNVADTQTYLYPRLVPIPYMDPNCFQVPTQIRCTFEHLRPDGVYVLDNGIHMFLWIGQAVNPQWIQNVIVPNAVGLSGNVQLFELDNPQSRQLRSLVAKLKSSRQRNMRLTLARHGDELSLYFKKFLAEDSHDGVRESYTEFICKLHKEVRTLVD